MIRLLVIFAALLVVFFGAPLLIERQSNACAAFGSQAAGALVQPPAAIAEVGGRAAAQLVYPNLPIAVGCTVLYWRAKFGDRP